ncbi:MAG: hypothetical protein R3D71_05900 [Rickettsiales bacterium]
MSNNNSWFRLYAEFAFDPKVQALSEALQRRYIMLLCMKCNGDLKKVTESNAKLALCVTATALRITEDEAKVTHETLVEFGLIEENWDIKKWNKRQYISDLKDPTLADRQRRFREKKRNGNVTERNGNVTEKKRPDTDTEKKKDISKDISKKKNFFFQIPEWIDSKTWNDFMEVREKKKAVQSERALNCLISQLDKIRKKGHDPNQIIEKSIVNSWKDVFEPDKKPDKKPTSNRVIL